MQRRQNYAHHPQAPPQQAVSSHANTLARQKNTSTSNITPQNRADAQNRPRAQGQSNTQGQAKTQGKPRAQHRASAQNQLASQRAPLFDQASAPIPCQRKTGGGMSEIILPMGSAQPQQAPQPTRQERPPRVGNAGKRRPAQAQAAPQRRITRGEARRRKFRKRLLAFIILFLVIAAGITLSVKVLFKIDNFVIDGDTTYTQEDILLAFGIPKGENIFSFKISEVETRMHAILPYAEEIQVRRRLPTTIVITTAPAQETYYASCADSSYAVLSQKLKVLRLSQEPLQDKPLLKGIDPVLPTVGEKIEYPSEEKRLGVERTLEALYNEGIDNYTEINVSNTLEIFFLYEKRVRVLLGTSNDLADKLAVVGVILRQNIGPSEHGTLDVSHHTEGKGRQGVWTPGTP